MIRSGLQLLRQAWRRRRWSHATAEVENQVLEVERCGFVWRLELSHYLDRELACEGTLERRTTEIVRRLIQPGMHVFDVGANFGYFTLIFARLVGSLGHVWAFEPTVEYGRRLRWHVERNGLSGTVTVLDYGLSDASRHLEISIGDSSATLHRYYESVRAHETVRLQSLDEAISTLRPPKIDVMKIDIDGHEPAMLRGAKGVLTRFRPSLVLEFAQECLDSAGSDVRELKLQLEDLGYVLYSETTLRPFASRPEFLYECGNFSRSANVWAIPVERAAASL